MAVSQIGTRLVRQFDEGGKNCKIVLSETLNGKTFTKVLDSNGNTILDRVKKIDRYNVGNKKVSTITKVSQGADSPLKKQVTDRVYNAESGLLGIRRTDIADIDFSFFSELGYFLAITFTGFFSQLRYADSDQRTVILRRQAQIRLVDSFFNIF